MHRKVDFGWDLCIGIALGLMLFSVKWVLAWTLAALVHELGHVGAVYLCKGKVYSVHLRLGGAKLETSPLSRTQEFICALAGPAAGLMLLLLGRWLPRTALLAAAQSLYNLLPLFPLDGGRALRCVIPWAERLGLVLVVLLGLWLTFGLGLGLIPLAVLTVTLFRRNSPCK